MTHTVTLIEGDGIGPEIYMTIWTLSRSIPHFMKKLAIPHTNKKGHVQLEPNIRIIGKTPR